MTDTALPVALMLASGVERMFPTLTPAQVKRIAVHGHVRSIRPGEVHIEAGEQVVPFFVVTAGRVEIVRPSGTTETLVAVHGPGQFTVEVNMFSGRPALIRARANEFAEQSAGQLPYRFAVIDVAGSEADGQQVPTVANDQRDFEAIPPPCWRPRVGLSP